MSAGNPFSEFSNAQADQKFAVAVSSTSGPNTAIAAPGAGKRICLVGGQLQNESATDQTALIKHGSTTLYRVNMSAKSYGALPPSPLFWRLPANTALIVDLAAAVATNYTFWYFTEDV